MAPDADTYTMYRGVHLLLIVLPPLRWIFRLLESQLGNEDQETRNFYRYFDVYTRFLLGDLWRLKALLHHPEPLAEEVLSELDRLLDDCITQSVHKSQIPSNTPYYKLRLFMSRWQAENVESKRLAAMHPFIHVGSLEQRIALNDTIKSYSDELNLRYPEDSFSHEDFQPPKKRRKEPSYAVGYVASSLYEAFSSRTVCTCHDSHDYAARIALATYRSYNESDDAQKLTFDAMICLDQESNDWRETHVQVSANKPKASGVQFLLQADRPENKTAKHMIHRKNLPQRQRIQEICKLLRSAFASKLQRLNLELENDVLYKAQSSKTRFSADELTNVISLGQLISSGASGLGDKVKRVLAVLLSYGVLHHYGGSWLDPSWGRDDILFIRSASAIPLRPYMFTRLKKPQRKSASIKSTGDPDDLDPDDFPIHPYPDLVTLGILLLELHNGKPLEVLAIELGIEEEQNVNAKWSMADEVLQKIRIDLPDNYLDAVTACLDPNFGSNSETEDIDDISDEDFRRLIYTEIVKPLEDELDQGFGKTISVDDLDNAAQTMDFGSWGQTFKRTASKELDSPSPSPPSSSRRPSRISGSHGNGHMHHNRQKRVDKQPHIPRLISIVEKATGFSRAKAIHAFKSAEPVVDDFELFDDASGTENLSQKSCQQSDAWMDMFRSTYDRYMTEEPTQRVKIAVLDTGIDRTHPEMQNERIKSVRSWVEGHNGEEEDLQGGDVAGHGTHTTSILLDLAPDADIYVARIAVKGPVQPDQIAKAIHHATSIWQVDIITMSFGYPRRLPTYPLLEQAIALASSSTPPTLLFAAASNHGGNRSRAYPARDDRVLAVHSTDTLGNPSPFNPSPLPDRDNLATLGEAVRGAWPPALCDLSANPEATQYKSGTSFATPILVAQAAFLLAFARQRLKAEEADLMLRTAGMRVALGLVAEKRKEFKYVAGSLAPDGFWGRGEEYVRVCLGEAVRRS
ncbi:subtilisin-like protein [Aulographum hederae CBS 113979]|uniref:Subtilisin-like protein n=1 Tax=Aulographum hederae CBS 113979 TaxID=1176131 RepID=A0A6G1GYH4_9PEZI|nr:subtilisin-like protein [Aulographum hederae CBS 113979]